MQQITIKYKLLKKEFIILLIVVLMLMSGCSKSIELQNNEIDTVSKGINDKKLNEITSEYKQENIEYTIYIPDMVISKGFTVTYQYPAVIPIVDYEVLTSIGDYDIQVKEIDLSDESLAESKAKMSDAFKFDDMSKYKKIEITFNKPSPASFADSYVNFFQGKLKVELDATEVIKEPDIRTFGTSITWISGLTDTGYYWDYESQLTSKEISDELLKVRQAELDEFSETYGDVYTDHIKELDQLIRMGKTDYEKVKIIYDWMINKYQYAYIPAEAEELENDLNGAVSNVVFLMENNSTRCGGFSAMFKLICDTYDISSVRVYGMSDDGNGHTWNAVHDKEKNEFLYVDVTYGLSYPDDNLVYLPNEEFSKKHLVWEYDKYVELTKTYLTVN